MIVFALHTRSSCKEAQIISRSPCAPAHRPPLEFVAAFCGFRCAGPSGILLLLPEWPPLTFHAACVSRSETLSALCLWKKLSVFERYFQWVKNSGLTFFPRRTLRCFMSSGCLRCFWREAHSSLSLCFSTCNVSFSHGLRFSLRHWFSASRLCLRMVFLCFLCLGLIEFLGLVDS